MLLTAVTFIVGGLGLASLPPLGLFLGQSMMDEQAKTSGYEWLTFVAMTAGALTGAAVLRVAGRVFLGWGRGARDSEQRQDGEGRETQAGGYRVPWVMLLPPLTLTAFGVALGVLPGVASISIHSAQMFANHSPYVRSVLGGPLPHWLPLDFPWTGLWRGAVTAGLAVALAGFWLAGPAIARGAGIPPRDYYGRAVRVLRSAHSGHPGDYVTWITIGTAVLGVLFLTLLR
jgi:multicomponent Na+:H+ antiporter subunit D